jgi:hypothetical protein
MFSVNPVLGNITRGKKMPGHFTVDCRSSLSPSTPTPISLLLLNYPLSLKLKLLHVCLILLVIVEKTSDAAAYPKAI